MADMGFCGMDILLLLIATITLCNTVDGMEYSNEVKTVSYSQQCYSCSSHTDLCQDAVYDGQYLTSLPCHSSCFLRTEQNVTYRGCFDGWIGGMVYNDYVGCRHQIYFGKKVEWCFCRDTSDTNQGEPCNGASRDQLAKGGGSYSGQLQSFNEYRQNKIYGSGYNQGQNMATFKEPVAKSGGDYATETEDLHSEVKQSLQLKPEYHKLLCYHCQDKGRGCGQRTSALVVPCLTKCYTRRTGDSIQLGCLDDWSDKEMFSGYMGCQQQFRQGLRSMWCFCGTTKCNWREVKNIDYRGDGMYFTQRSSVMMEPHGYPSHPPRLIGRLAARRGRAGDVYDQRHPAEPISIDYNTNVGTAQYGYAPDEDYSYYDNRPSQDQYCHGLRDGIHGDPYDCTRYVHCYRGYAHRRNCPYGTVFSDNGVFCDYKWNVGFPCGWKPT